jgi:uncharacterized protein (DUF2062 family)
MYEFLRDFFSSREAFARAVRALSLALAAAALTPEGQAALAAALGPYAALVPIVVALLAGGVAVGEKNPKP